MSNIFHPTSFNNISGLTVALSLRDQAQPGEFSMLPTNTTMDVVMANRKQFAETLGFKETSLIRANQDHTNLVEEVTDAYPTTDPPQADALISKTPGWLIGVTIADCVGLALYDPVNSALGIVHSGRKGTIGRIASNTIHKMQESYGTDPAELLVYLSPCPNPDEYPIDLDTAKACDPRYLSPTSNPNEVYYDNRLAVYDQLIEEGVAPEHIEIDERSTISNPQLHSYRRDGDKAGRMMLAIGLKNEKF